MAISGSPGGSANSTTDSTSISCTAGTSLWSPGDLIVVIVGCDNAGVSGASPVSGCTDTKGTTYTQHYNLKYSPSIQANSAVALAVFTGRVVSTGLSPSDTITVSFGGITVHSKCMLVWQFRQTLGSWDFSPTDYTTEGSGTSIMNWSGNVTVAHCVLAMACGESNQPLGYDADTVFGFWSNQHAGIADTFNSSSSITLTSQFKVPTTTGFQEWRASIADSGVDWVSVGFVFREVAPTIVEGAGTATPVTALTGTGTGTIVLPTVVEATGAGPLGTLTASATSTIVAGTTEATGTAPSMGALAGAVTGVEIILGATATAPAMGQLAGTASGVPILIITEGGPGSAPLGGLTGTATGVPTEIIVGSTASAALGPLTGTGTSAIVLDATGAATLGPLTGTATGVATEIIVGASGSATFSMGQSIATATTTAGTTEATADATLGPLAGTATGTPITVVGATATAALGPLAGTATGVPVEIIVNTVGATVLGPITGTASGVPTGAVTEATGTATLGPLTGTGTSSVVDVTVQAGGSATFSMGQCIGAPGVLAGDTQATGAAALGPFTGTATGVEIGVVQADADALLGPLTGTATGVEIGVVGATGSAPLGSLTGSGLTLLGATSQLRVIALTAVPGTRIGGAVTKTAQRATLIIEPIEAPQPQFTTTAQIGTLLLTPISPFAAAGMYWGINASNV